MSLPRFFLDTQVISEEADALFALDLSKDDLKHLSVLRLSPKEHVAIIDAQSDYFECRIECFEGNTPIVSICSHENAGSTGPYVVLVQGLAKADRFELVIRHATELGVRGFVPFEANRSVMKVSAAKLDAKMTRWKTIARSAAMQSGQPCLPKLFNPLDLSQLSQWLSCAGRVLICWEEAQASSTLKAALQGTYAEDYSEEHPLVVVVGPEGGLDSDEVMRLCASNSNSSLISLGDFILRTETAGIVAPALALYELGQLGGSLS